MCHALSISTNEMQQNYTVTSKHASVLSQKGSRLREIYEHNDQLYKSWVYDYLRTFIVTVIADWKR